MQMLEYFYENGLKKDRYLKRKLTLEKSARVILSGVKYSGKYSLLQEHFQSQKDTLFIDMEDLRFNYEIYKKEITDFLRKKDIKNLILYGFKEGYFIPKCDNIYISSHNNISLDGYLQQRLSLLNFEEFILFDRSKDIKVIFNNYLKAGNYPETALLSDAKRAKRINEVYKLSFDNEIFKEIAFFQSMNISAYFIFNRLKQKTKISKDRFYEYFENIENDGYIHLISKLNSKRGAKKLYFHNFLTKSYYYTQKEFPKIFENMVFLELQKDNLFYLEPLGLYDIKTGYLTLPIPFGNEVRIEDKINKILAKNRIKIEKIEVISVTSSFEYSHQGIFTEVIPFYEWALR